MIETLKQEFEPRRVSALRNILANWGAFAYGGLVSFCLAPVVVRHLGDSLYGVWILLGTVVGYLGIIDFGVRGAVMRYVANLHAAVRHDEAGRLASAGLFLFSVLGVIAIVIAGLLAFGLERLFTIPEDFKTQAQLVLIIGGVTIAVSLVSGVYGGVIAAMQRFDVNSLIEFSIETTRACLILLALSADHGIVALAAIQCAMAVARGVLTGQLSRRLYPQLKLSLLSWQRPHLRQLVRFSFYSTLLQISTIIIFEVDAVIIGSFLPIAMVGYFAVAANLVGYARTLVSAAAQTITPRVSALQGTGDHSGMNRLLLASGRWATLMILVFALTLSFRGESFIRLWMGPHFAELGGPVLFVLALAMIGEGGRLVVRHTLLGLDQHKPLVPVFIAEALCNLALSIVLVRSFGIVGVAWGTAIPRVIATTLLIPMVLRRRLGIPLWDTWREVWIWPGLAMIPFGLATYFIERIMPAQSMAGFFATVLLAMPLALIGSWRIGLHPAERLTLASEAATRFRNRRFSGMRLDSDDDERIEEFAGVSTTGVTVPGLTNDKTVSALDVRT